MPENDKKIAILILAAGASSRMGRPKQLLPWKETTLLGNAIDTALKLRAGDIFVVLGANFEKILPSISEKNITIVENPNWKLGMGTSIAAGIGFLVQEKKSYDGVMILLCDQPLLSAPYLNDMIRCFGQNGEKITATEYDDKPGVPVIFGQKYFDELCDLKGDSGAKKIIDANRKDVMLMDAKGEETDVDTQIEYNRLVNQRSRP